MRDERGKAKFALCARCQKRFVPIGKPLGGVEDLLRRKFIEHTCKTGAAPEILPSAPEFRSSLNVTPPLITRHPDVDSTAQLDAVMRDILALEGGAADQAPLTPEVEGRGVSILGRNPPQAGKAYIRRAWQEKPDDYYTIEFCESVKNALQWGRQAFAEHDLATFERGVKIPSAGDGIYICEKLTIERARSEEYVISLEAPFLCRPKK